MRPPKKTFKKPFDFTKLSPFARDRLSRALAREKMLVAGPGFMRLLNSVVYRRLQKRRR